MTGSRKLLELLMISHIIGLEETEVELVLVGGIFWYLMCSTCVLYLILSYRGTFLNNPHEIMYTLCQWNFSFLLISLV